MYQVLYKYNTIIIVCTLRPISKPHTLSYLPEYKMHRGIRKLHHLKSVWIARFLYNLYVFGVYVTPPIFFLQFSAETVTSYSGKYRRPGFNCVVKQLRFWLFKVDCEFKDCDLLVLRIGHTCVIHTLRSNNCELREKSQFAIFKLHN